MVGLDTWTVWLGVALFMSVAVVGTAVVAPRLYRSEVSCDDVVWAVTSDGWRLGLRVYRPAEVLFVEPVILCHGLGVSGLHFDLLAELSLARRLAAAGFLVVVPDLRGRGLSRTAPSGARPVTFADHAQRDAPALFEAALRLSGSPRAFWVGHSMGGMTGAVTAAARPEALAGLVAMGVPYRVEAGRDLRRVVRAVLAWPGTFPLAFAARLLAPVVTPTWPPAGDLVAVRRHLDRRTLSVALAHLVAEVPRSLLSELAAWSDERGPLVANGEGYPDHWLRVTCPLLVLAGSADALAPPGDARRAFSAAASREKTWTVFGETSEMPQGVGHGDLLLGRTAPSQVFPAVERWLASHARRTAAGMVQIDKESS